ncbi:MAG: hypothetical protein AB9869_28600 [Verrucomicrobiia bacterium]
MDASGTPLANGDYELSFRIYDAAENGMLTWGPQTFNGQVGTGLGPRIPVVQGRFNVILGPSDTAGNSLSTAFANAPRYLEIKVASNNPIAPRQQILSAPYALNAEKLAGFDWGAFFNSGDPASGTINGSRITDGTIDGSKIGMLNHLTASDGSPTNAVYVDASGKVGIGTTSPTADLHVAGNVNLASALYVDVLGGRVGIGAPNIPIIGTTVSKLLVAGDIRVDEMTFVANAGSNKKINVGERYRDNALVAWGFVQANGTVNARFGVTKVDRRPDPSKGVYDVTLDAAAVQGVSLIPIAIAELDTPPTDAATARIVSVNGTGTNTFTVYINNGSFQLVNNDFYFIVTAR